MELFDPSRSINNTRVWKRYPEEKENIEILFNCNTLGLFGENGVEGAHLVKFKGTYKEETLDIDIDGFFLAITEPPHCGV